MNRKQRFVIGVDVGTGSVRAGVFDLKGKSYGVGVKPIKIWRPKPDFVEQSSDDIWRACGAALKSALKQAGAKRDHVAGISFDATCSLVCLDARDRALTVSPTGRHEQNVIVWMDHRAIDQAARINAAGHKVLRYVGGGVSPEMEPPKLLWLKENLTRTWSKAARYLDLADFMTYRATGVDVRSLCTTVCKWTYQGHLGGKVTSRKASGGTRGRSVGRWDDTFWAQIGLDDLVTDGHRRIGNCIRPMGEPVGEGLTPEAARTLGLAAGTPVGVGIIDAHAGGLGMIGAKIDGQAFHVDNAHRRVALIGGTSSCHMAVSPKPQFIRGVWGPYYSAMVPGLWLTEGGQSATGALVDYCIESSRHAAALGVQARRSGKTVYELLNDRLKAMASPRGKVRPAVESARLRMAELTSRFHVLGDHHGNRSPRANPLARGMVSGLTLNDTVDALALEYLATLQAVAYGTRHIIEAMNGKGFDIEHVLACGGGTKNPVFVQQHADVTGCEILLPAEPEAVLLGAAVLAAVAAGAYPDCIAAMSAMNRIGRSVKPVGGAVREYHNRKFDVYKRMYGDQRRYDVMTECTASVGGCRG